ICTYFLQMHRAGHGQIKQRPPRTVRIAPQGHLRYVWGHPKCCSFLKNRTQEKQIWNFRLEIYPTIFVTYIESNRHHVTIIVHWTTCQLSLKGNKSVVLQRTSPSLRHHSRPVGPLL